MDNALHKIIAISFLVLVMACCNSPEKNKLFQLLPSTKTNVTFANQLTETDSFNILTFEYIYNGAGVGVGDVNNDGLTDMFFAGNMVSSKLYLNKGSFEFQDVTEKSAVTTDAWCTGVAMVDINQDGLLDIYVSTIQPYMNKPSVPNLLFLNQGFGKDGVPSARDRREGQDGAAQTAEASSRAGVLRQPGALRDRHGSLRGRTLLGA